MAQQHGIGCADSVSRRADQPSDRHRHHVIRLHAHCIFREGRRTIEGTGILGADVVGLSVQTTEYQKEMADRLHLPFPIVSDVNYEFQKALNMPTFVAAGMTLLKRVTLIANDGVIVAVHYPIFPSDSDPAWVINYLKQQK